MHRRRFLAGVTALVSAPFTASAQPPHRPARIGLLDLLAPDPARQRLWDAFHQRLHELGYADAQHLIVEFRSAHGQTDALHGLAMELVRLNVDVMVTTSTPAALAARRATTTVPIVMTNAGDPVAAGLAASLAHPGGNVTGLTTLSPDLSAKRLELLGQLAPAASRIAVLWEETNPAFVNAVRDVEGSARSSGLQVLVQGLRSPEDIDRAFSSVIARQAGAVLVMPGTLLLANRKRLTELAAKHRLPAMYAQREYVEAGGLAAYGSSLVDLYVRAADFVAKILKGARPAALPIEQPTKFELVINLKTAKALGVKIPAAVLARADEVIDP